MCERCAISDATLRQVVRDRIRTLFKNCSVRESKIYEGISVVGKVPIDVALIKLKSFQDNVV